MNAQPLETQFEETLQSLSVALNPQQVQFFEEAGYLILEEVVPSSLCEALREQAHTLVSQFDPGQMVSIFSTKNQTQTADAYFMESGDKIRFFFEEESFTEEGLLQQPKAQSINKIGHALHELDPLFTQFSHLPPLEQIVRALGLQDPRLVQSMYIFKQPRIGGEVQCHQDSTFLYTNPLSVIGLWFALEEATLENGCLWALPEAQKAGIKSRFVRTPEGKPTFEIYDDSPWPLEGLVPLEVPEGSLIVLHGALPHLSKANRSAHSRHAYSLHIIDGVCEYPLDNWLQRPPSMPFRGF